MIDLTVEILRLLGKGEHCVLATILTHDGSTPRTAGARMVIRRDGGIYGTIGGGRLEAEVMAAAPAVIETGQDRRIAFDLGTSETAEDMDMICGGRVTVLMERINADGSQSVFETLARALQQGESGWLVRRIVPETGDLCRVERFWRSGKNPLPSDGSLPPAVTEALGRQRRLFQGPVSLDLGGETFWAEPVCAAATVLIFGAGHVSREVADLAVRVGFRTVVLDDRADFVNRRRFSLADDIRVVADFEHALEGVDVTADTHVVIVTRGHRHDQTVLALALKTSAGYIGMIGSRRKRDTIYRNLLAMGFSEDDLARVHCPIGLPIGAETPEEIAVSIVAELIAVRAEKAPEQTTAKNNRNPHGR